MYTVVYIAGSGILRHGRAASFKTPPPDGGTLPATKARSLAGVFAVSLLLVVPVQADPAPVDRQVRIAILDTGLDPGHPEVDMDRVVAWWDFGTAGHPLPRGTEAWDPVTPTPFDTYGHGTGVASLVAGRTLGAFPEAELVVARLDDGDGNIVNVAAAIRWAVAMDADILSLSIGTIVPLPSALDDSDEAVRLAYEAGALPVIAAGNGLVDLGVPAPSETTSPSDSPYALVVGAEDALFSNTDPDVVAPGVDVCMARAEGTAMALPHASCQDGDPRYGRASGTSFSTPLVSGLAGRALQAAFDAGRAPSVDEVRDAVMRTARDSSAPYVFEGYGVVDAETAEAAAALLVSGAAAPASPNDAAHALAHRLRTLWTMDLEQPGQIYVPRGADPNSIGVSTIAFRDAELWTLSTQKGQIVRLRLDFEEKAADLDLAVYRASALALPLVHGAGDALATGQESGREDLTFVSPGGLLEVAVEGWSVLGDVTYTLTVTLDGQTAQPTYLGDHALLDGTVLA